jgi:hypothetical protein
VSSPKAVEAAIPVPCAFGSLRIGLIQVGEDGLCGRIEAVEIEPIKTSTAVACTVVFAKPFGQGDDIHVAPHPGWEPSESREQEPHSHLVLLEREAIHTG